MIENDAEMPSRQPDCSCQGPLIWFDVPPDNAILECAHCGYIVVTGSLNDARHASAEILREGLS